MKRLFVLMLLLPSLAWAGPTLEGLRLSAEFSPPHNEAVVGDFVARYRGQLTGEIQWGRVTWKPKLTAWGVNTWRSPEVVGHGLDAWEGSDWSVEKWRFSSTQNLSIRLLDRLSLTTEYYMPIDRKDWGGHGLERHYYWLTGFEVKLR